MGPRMPDSSLVKCKPGDLDQRPVLTVQRAVVQRAIEWHALQLAVGGVAPGVVGADEQRRVALLVATDLHAAMAAGVQEHMHGAGCVATQDNRFLTHAGGEEITRLGDQAFVSDEQPCAGEELLQFLAVEVGRDEDFAADHAALQVDHLVHGQRRGHPPNLPMVGRSVLPWVAGVQEWHVPTPGGAA